MTITDTKTEILSGAKVLVETLKKLNVDTVFGYPGGIVLNVYDELYKQNNIKHYLVRHEQSAVHAAEGYARVSGKCGVVLVTSGPGATNIVTGVANAYLDGYPLVVITGQVPKSLIGKDAFQEVDIVDITKSCTKKTFQVMDVKNLEKTLVDAFATAMSGKQGPVVVDIPKDIFVENVEFDKNIQYGNDLRGFFANAQNDVPGNISKALSEICKAKCPVMVAGGGVVQADAQQELEEFARLLNIPVVNTMMGLGTFNQEDEKYLGMIGLFGDFSANQALRESDLIFSVGARFNDRIRCCFNSNELERHFIQLDINESEISKLVPAATSLVGDAKLVLAKMISDFKTGNFEYNHSVRNEWLKDINSYKSKNKVQEKRSEKLHSYEVIKTISDYLEAENPIVATEVGQHQVWVSRAFKFNKPRKFLTSGGLGTMGFGFPAAIGACVANDKNPVLCIAGDGSFQMSLQELAVCADYNLPVKIFVMNNGYLGMVRQFQEKICDKRYSETGISNPDYVKLASAYGISALKISQKDEIVPAVKQAFAIEGPVIVDILIEPEEVL